MKYLLDTNVISELVARFPDTNVVNWVDGLPPSTIFLSVVTIGELRKGIEKLPDSTRKQRLDRWLEDDLLVRFTGRILTIDIPVMLTWGALVGGAERAGRPLAAMDSLIAAIALHNRCVLATRNESDFMNTGVETFNPWKQSL